MKTNSLFALLLLTVSISPMAKAQDSNCIGTNDSNCKVEFQPRNESECGDINPDMGNWFRKEEKATYEYVKKGNRYDLVLHEISKAPIENKVGPIRDQGNIGWCFAFAAADMMSSQSNTYISAAQVAKNYFTKSKIAWIWGGKEGGFINSAIDLSLNKPLCEEKTFPSKGLNINSAKEVQCNEPVITISNLKTKTFSAQGNPGGASLFPELDRVLNDGEIAGIHYNANKAYMGAKDTILNAWANHASTIVARYFDKSDNTCRYIVRNTWGANCMSTSSKDVKCKSGYYSLTEENLNRSLTQVIELKNR